jgi:hypothetical protein
MKDSLTLLAEAAVAVDSIRLQMLELEHIINQIHASRDYQAPDEYDPTFLEWATAILRTDLPGGLERVRTLFDSAAYQEIRAGWISLYFDMCRLKDSALASIWTTDVDMMRKAVEVQAVLRDVWDQVDIQLELNPELFASFRKEFAYRFDWSACTPPYSQYDRLYDHFMKYFDRDRDSRHPKAVDVAESGDVGQ